MMSDVFELVTNPISIEGHIRSYPIVLKDKPVWRNSVERALIVQNLFTNYDFERARIHRVAGHADRNLATESPTEIRNNRLEITLLRTGYTQ
jgi:chemotaxis protein MotB